jgi:hypothetical protein
MKKIVRVFTGENRWVWELILLSLTLPAITGILLVILLYFNS